MQIFVSSLDLAQEAPALISSFRGPHSHSSPGTALPMGQGVYRDKDCFH